MVSPQDKQCPNTDAFVTCLEQPRRVTEMADGTFWGFCTEQFQEITIQERVIYCPLHPGFPSIETLQ
jgi:hypothetical protein